MGANESYVCIELSEVSIKHWPVLAHPEAANAPSHRCQWKELYGLFLILAIGYSINSM